jgi:hypothetical protein
MVWILPAALNTVGAASILRDSGDIGQIIVADVVIVCLLGDTSHQTDSIETTRIDDIRSSRIERVSKGVEETVDLVVLLLTTNKGYQKRQTKFECQHLSLILRVSSFVDSVRFGCLSFNKDGHDP